METAEIKDKFVQYCKARGASYTFLEKATYKVSTKGNLMCLYHGTSIVLDPEGERIINGSSSIFSGIQKEEKRQELMESAISNIKSILPSEEFLSKYIYAKYVELFGVSISKGKVSIRPVPKKGIHVRLIPELPLLPAEFCANAKTEDILESLNGQYIVSGLTESFIQSLSSRLYKIANSYCRKANVRKNESYFPEAARKRYRHEVKMLTDKAKENQRVTAGGLFNKKITLCYGPFSFTYNIEEDSITIDPCIEKGLDEISLLREYKSQYGKIQDAMKKNLPKGNEFKILLKKERGGKNAPFKYEVSFSLHGEEFIEETGMGDEDIENLISRANDFITEANKKYDKYCRQIKNKVLSSGLYGDILAKTILECVEGNRFMTENLVCKILRGTKMNTWNDYFYPPNAGKFNLIPEDEIRDIVQKMIKLEILKEWYVDGKYNGYNAIECGNSIGRSIIEEECRLHYGKDKKFDAYTDTDWKLYLSKTEPGSLSEKYWTKLLPVFDHPAVYCTNSEMFTNFFSKAPASFLEYIETVSTVEEGGRKKIMKDMMKKLKAKDEENH